MSSTSAASVSSSAGNNQRINLKAFLPHNLHKSNNNKASCLSENLEPSRAGQRCLFPFLPHEICNRPRLSEATPTFVPSSSSANGVIDSPGGGSYGHRDILSAAEGRQRPDYGFVEFHDPHRDMRLDVDNMSYEDLLVLEERIGNVRNDYGFVEFRDPHKDMRLDVDNMSYEELLALEERIGNVSSGLNKSFIRGSIRQRKYKANKAALNLEPCSICWEDYVDGVDIGKLDCGHEFHTGCIQRWLTLKNTCPICKMTAIERRRPFCRKGG